ncbi:MAG: hypothetical protein ABL959_09930 [Pyrinomonadaceae bacterium]
MAIRVSLGGPDNASIRFLKQWPRGFFISPLVDYFDENLQEFLTKQYFQNGAALFGGETPDELQRIREWARGYLDEVSDRDVYLIAQYFVQRVRNYVHIRALSESRVAWAVAVGCHNGRRIDVEQSRGALRLIKRFSLLEYSEEVWGKDLGFPPFGIECVCRMEGIIAGSNR